MYGCDVCQDVCPWNRKFALELAQNSPFAPRDLTASSHSRELALELSAMSPAEYASVFRGSAMKRAKLRGLRRNAAVVLGNSGAQKAITALSLALDDEDPLLRSHAAWALGRIASFDARVSLECRLDREVDRDVRVALMRALESSSA